MSKYTIEQKNKAVEHALQESSLTLAANKFNIPTSTLHSWIKEYRLIKQDSSNLNKIDIKKKLNKKDQEIKKLKEELEILKKFKAFSAKPPS